MEYVMLSVSYPDVVSIFAGIFGGLVIGINLTTKTEMEIRGLQSGKVSPFFRVPLLDGIKFVLVASLFMLLIGGVSLVVALVTFWFGLGRFYCNTPDMQRAFGLSYLLGAGAAKYARYLVWRSKQA